MSIVSYPMKSSLKIVHIAEKRISGTNAQHYGSFVV